MKQVVFAAVAAFTLGAGALAQAQAAWEPVGTKDGKTVTYNPATVQRNGTVVTSQVKYEGPEAVMPKAGSFGTAIPPSSYQEKMAIDCAAHTWAAQQTTGYSFAGTLLYQFNNGATMLPLAQVPVLQALEAKVCK